MSLRSKVSFINYVKNQEGEGMSMNNIRLLEGKLVNKGGEGSKILKILSD